MAEGFEDLGFEISDFEPKVIDLLMSLCDIYPVSHDTIGTEYISFLLKKNGSTDSVPTLELLDSFEKDHLSVMKTKLKENAKRGIVNVNQLSLIGNGVTTDDEDEDLSSMYGIKTTPTQKTSVKRQITPDNHPNAKKMFGTPATQSFSPSSLQVDTPNAGKYANRTNSGDTLLTFGEGSIRDWKMEKETFAAEIKPSSKQPLDKPYRYMFESLREKAGFLDETLCRVEDQLASKFGLDESQALALSLIHI